MGTSAAGREVAREQVQKKVNKKLTAAEKDYLSCGLEQPGGKLPLFDNHGQEINSRLIRSCLKKGFAERWFANPIKPDWLVCRLTEAGRQAAS